MRKAVLLLAGAFSLLAAPAMGATPEGEAKLAKALEGRVAGEPVNCVNLRGIRSSKIIDGTAIIYDAGGTLYVNRPESGAAFLDNWDVLVTKTHSSRLCDIDVVYLYDSGTRMQSGSVMLGEFIPYRLPD